jgi:ParB-like chromosome segregation protein Spo0J
MKIEEIKINKLKPAKYNPRIELKKEDESYQRIKSSIEEFGLVDPLVVNKRNMTIIGGHQRYNILKDLGYEVAECILVDLDEKQEKRLNLSLNKNSGFWDETKLEELFNELELSQEELFATGFSAEEIENLKTDFIEDLLQEDFSDKGTNELNKFAMTFNIDKVYEEKYLTYVKNYGKEQLIGLMTAEVLREVQ